MQKQVEYSEAIKTKYPEQVVIAIAKDKNGKANPVTLGWTMIVSGNPPMMAIGVARKHYSIEAITHSKCFTIAFPSAQMAEAALFFGSRSGRDTDKFAELDCATEPAKEIDSLLLTDAVANFECRLQSQVPTGDHITFIGEIVCSHINTEPKQRLYTVGPGHKLGPAS
ncbi:MAG TPA: flavin reductase family protein [Sedimentisphaerales bacterium]|jgi:flavin reductase (DIM6/NTAB) family NADH-FMN oxidoreductase RutF|nr:flavin reductase family protein [Sedimentisphaerales bacterium]